MLKSILLGSAILFAIPAMAQTTGSTTRSGTPTTTNDHDPTMEDDATTTHSSHGTVAGQVDGGTTSSVTGVHGTAPTSHQGMHHGTKPATPHHQGMSHQGMSHGAAGSAAGTASTQGSVMGVGGPYVPRDYPVCSRTVQDSCIQMPGHRIRR